MPKLTDEVQTFIVEAHACHRKVSLIQQDVKAEFGIDVDRQLVQHYHPEKGAKDKRLAKRWKTHFEQMRKAFDEGKVEAGIAKQSFRLLLYQRAAEFYEGMGNYVLAAEMAERAAKEMGGYYTNKREITGAGGKPLIPEGVSAAIDKVYGDQGDTAE